MQPQPRSPELTPHDPLPKTSVYAPGGDVGALYGELRSRFATDRVVRPFPPLETGERVIQAISRAAGWVAVAACAVAMVVLFA